MVSAECLAIVGGCYLKSAVTPYQFHLELDVYLIFRPSKERLNKEHLATEDCTSELTAQGKL